ncbi:DUF3325 family protein [Stutzerimonas xanthomarina]|uniref:DUF3325 domain-containing protein n=2 Tax=Stutzerimonas xanthomarina TaxID=271420 RepID=A0A1M5L4U0_9GAMM|nr:DUF3325 family protein [Stutzerimonas xanthomarina]MCP9340276.1 DUF3325 domain-containing protein [Stutzerimonas xanthomarina]SEH50964.1 Protein of unknown function [Stutzerimonas xanthomarina]SHG59955.1 Protein of unknown function [Stutzerimonas xanthomarina DSM 18231]
MPELMQLGVFVLCYLAFAQLALLQQAHRQKVWRSAAPPTARGRQLRRNAAVISLAGAPALLMTVEVPGFAVLLWLCLMSAAAVAVALTLSWKPGLLRWLP